MPYSESLDKKIGDQLVKWNADRRKMFGGTCYLLRGNMLCGVYKDYLIVRLGEEEATKALKLKHTKQFDITGKPMKGWVMIREDKLKTADIKKWLERGKAFVKTLPKK